MRINNGKNLCFAGPGWGPRRHDGTVGAPRPNRKPVYPAVPQYPSPNCRNAYESSEASTEAHTPPRGSRGIAIVAGGSHRTVPVGGRHQRPETHTRTSCQRHQSATSTGPWHRSQLRVKDAYNPATRVRTGSAPKTSEPRLDCDGITLWLLRRVPALGSFDVRALVRVAGLGPVLAPLTHFQQASRGRVVCGCWDATIDRACFTNAWPYLYTDGSLGRKHGYRYGVLAFIVSRLPETQLWVAATRRSINRRCNILSRALNVIRGRFRL